MISKISLSNVRSLNFASAACKNKSSNSCSECKDCKIKEDNEMPFIYAQMYFKDLQDMGISPDVAFEQACKAYFCYNGNV